MSDIRVKRTYAMLCNAFEELLEQKFLGDITVSELCERSTVRRGTFYRHFEDLDAFVRYYLTTLTARFMDELAPECDLTDLRTYASQMHSRMLDFNIEHREMSNHILGRNFDAQVLEMLVTQIADGITKRIEEDVAAESTACEPSTRLSPEFISIFYSAGLVYTMRWWLQAGTPSGKERLVDECTKLLMGMTQSRLHALRPLTAELQDGS